MKVSKRTVVESVKFFASAGVKLDPKLNAVLGMRQVKLNDVQKCLDSVEAIKLVPGLPIVVKLIVQKGKILEFSVSPGPTLKACKFLMGSDDCSISMKVVNQFAKLKIDFDSVNTLNIDKVSKTILSTLKSAKRSVEGI